MKFRIFKLLLVIAFGIFAIKAFSASFYYLRVHLKKWVLFKLNNSLGQLYSALSVN